MLAAPTGGTHNGIVDCLPALAGDVFGTLPDVPTTSITLQGDR